jgi:hypothetical protein
MFPTREKKAPLLPKIKFAPAAKALQGKTSPV